MLTPKQRKTKMHANYIGLAKHDKTKNTDRIRERAK